jgi:hypothetical protein
MKVVAIGTVIAGPTFNAFYNLDELCGAAVWRPRFAAAATDALLRFTKRLVC